VALGFQVAEAAGGERVRCGLAAADWSKEEDVEVASVGPRG
jgi:hypothetical protein